MTNAADQSGTTGLWDFAVQLYGRPGVQDACLDLQDRLGLDVDLLLFAVWSAAAGPGQLDAESFKDCIALTAPWREDMLVPLRALRRAGKDGFTAVPPESSQAIAKQLQAVELAAERVQLAMLEHWATARGGRSAPADPAAAAASNVVAYLAASGVPTQAAAPAIRALLAGAFSPPTGA